MFNSTSGLVVLLFGRNPSGICNSECIRAQIIVLNLEQFAVHLACGWGWQEAQPLVKRGGLQLGSCRSLAKSDSIVRCSSLQSKMRSLGDMQGKPSACALD